MPSSRPRVARARELAPTGATRVNRVDWPGKKQTPSAMELDWMIWENHFLLKGTLGWFHVGGRRSLSLNRK